MKIVFGRAATAVPSKIDAPNGESTAYTKLVSDLIKLEADGELLEVRFRELRIYQHLRLPIFYHLAAHAGLFRSRKLPSRTQRVRAHIRSIGRIIRQNEFWGVRPAEILAVSSGREIMIGGTVSEICLHHLLPRLQGVCCPVFFDRGDDRGAGRFLSFHYFDMRARLEERLHRTAARLGWRSSLYKDAASTASVITSSLAALDPSATALNAFLTHRIMLEYTFWRAGQRMLDLVQPKLLIVVVAYQHAYLVSAAKQRGIPVVELQHGIIHARHQGYNYPHVPLSGVDVFPDYLFTFGNYWNDATAFPVPRDRRIAVGFPHFEFERHRVSANALRSEKQVLFISQNTIGDALFEIAKEVAEYCPDYNVLYKLHPKETLHGLGAARDRADSLPENLRVIGSGSAPLYTLFASTTWQIGVFSTAIYEGIGMGLKTIVVQLPGWENMSRLVESGAVLVASDAVEIAGLLASAEASENSSLAQAFFRPDAISNMVYELNRIRTMPPGDTASDAADIPQPGIRNLA